MRGKVLVVDDERLIRWSLHERLVNDGFDAVEAEDGLGARRIAENTDLELAILDLRLPDTDGVTLLRALRQIIPDLPTIIITAYSSVEGAVEAMKSGASDYLTKPFNLDELSIVVRRVLETAAMRKRLSLEALRQKEHFGLANIIGKSPRMAEIKDLVMKIAQSDATSCLLLGESGVGKNLIARTIHVESSRATQPFMSMTCSALADAELEVELFGQERGAGTEAPAQKKGLFELAQGGTVLLADIGELSLGMQAKLLRVLDEKVFRRKGGVADIGLDVRLVVTANHGIEQAVEEGVFREDLYYWLAALPVAIPPLRDRLEDLPELIDYFMTVNSRDFPRGLQGISSAAIEKMSRYDWPGNLRELRNVLERAALLCVGNELTEDDILLGRVHLGAAPHAEKFRVRLPDSGCALSDVEAELVRQALLRAKWNQTRAAALLGITRDQIRYKMEKFHIRGD